MNIKKHWIPLIIIGIILLFPIFKGLFRFFKGIGNFIASIAGLSDSQIKTKQQNEDIVNKTKDQINYSQLSISESEAMSIANKQYNAMEHSGTNEKILFETLQGLNKEDLKLVFVKYGVRTLHVFFFDDIEGTLTDAYLSELSGSQLNKMRQVWSGVQIF